MADSNLTRMESALCKQQKVLTELIDIALQAVRESADTSVAAMHVQTRLLALEHSLKPTVRGATAESHVARVGTRRVS